MRFYLCEGSIIGGIMIYQFYGFNIVCNCMIENMQEYCREELDKELPTVSWLVDDNQFNEMKDGISVAGNYETVVFTNHSNKI